MTVKDVADLLFAARGRIDFYWNFYVVVVIAVIGWLLTSKRGLTVPMKVLVSVAYLVAASMNLLGLHGAYTFAEALRTDLIRMASGVPLIDTRVILERHSYLPQRSAAFWIHLSVGATILLVVWFAHFPRSDDAAPTTGEKNAETRTSHDGHRGS
jgi:cytochrome b561